MRDLVFKNLTSEDKKRKILISSEIVDKQGIRTIIRRHFICMVKELKDRKIEKPLPYLYVRKERNTKQHTEKFFCRVKGSVYAICNGRIFLIIFMHSLRIDLCAIPEHLVKYSEGEF